MTHSLMLAVTIDPVVLTSVGIFLAVACFAFYVMSRMSGDDKPRVEARLDVMRRGPMKASLTKVERKQRNKDRIANVLEKATSPMGDSVAGNEKEMGKLRETLMNAGFRGERAPVVFKGIQVILAGTGLFFGGVFGLISDGLTTGLIMKIAGGIVVGYMVPTFLLSYLASRRKTAVFLGLPDALDLMVVCVEAGLGMDQALRKVAEEMQKSHKSIAEEFGIANSQLQLGRTRNEVLQALGFRSGVDDLKQLASILIQADKFGSSIGQALRVQSDSMRVKRRQIAEEKAAKTAVQMIFPLVLFIFPGIFVVLVGPAGINMYRQLLTK